MTATTTAEVGTPVLSLASDHRPVRLPRRAASGHFHRVSHWCAVFLAATGLAATALADDDTTTGDGAKSPPATAPARATQTHVVLKTSLGDIVIELDAERAPLSVANFLEYVDAESYDGTIFHRVIPTFMVQGGGFDSELRARPTRPPIRNEASNGVKNRRGTVAMARTNDAHSATMQFFINVVDNPGLDHDPAKRSDGYAVFGRVVAGMEAVDAIRKLPTRPFGIHQNVPEPRVTITQARALDREAAEKLLASDKSEEDGKSSDPEKGKEKEKDKEEGDKKRG